MRNPAKPRKKHTGLKTFIILLAVLILFCIVYYLLGIPRDGHNPHHLTVFNREEIQSLHSITRLDEDGHLYSMNYTAVYDTLFSKTVLNAVQLAAKNGCTVFTATEAGTGHVLSGRNFDYPHEDDEGNPTGANVVLFTKPEDGYQSIAMADGAIFQEIGVPVQAGDFDNGTYDISLNLLLPWFCMDGMNEKGLCGTVLYVDVAPGENAMKETDKGKETVIVTELFRHILDNCADIDQAIALADTYNIINIAGHNYQLYLSDATGRSVVFDWRFHQLQVIETDAATNFCLCADDAQDCIYPEGLKEAWTGPADTEKEYRYGYGHGYERFKTVVTALDEASSSLTRENALQLLRDTLQQRKTELDSHTQYSILYDSTSLQIELWATQDFSKSYTFSFE